MSKRTLEQLQKDIDTQQQKKTELDEKTKELEGNKIEIQEGRLKMSLFLY